VIGKWLKKTGLRKEFFIATKFGFDENFNIRGDPQFVREEFKKSSKKLGVEQIDLFYQHRPDPKTPIEVTVGAMAELVK
jgi:aryl-alcohol dehydrogenase-like predicted oxidoreductase